MKISRGSGRVLWIGFLLAGQGLFLLSGVPLGSARMAQAAQDVAAREENLQGENVAEDGEHAPAPPFDLRSITGTYASTNIGRGGHKCLPIKQLSAFEVAGYYPTTYCIHYNENKKKYRVSIEGFVFRDAF